jgi:hypothetical protein
VLLQTQSNIVRYGHKLNMISNLAFSLVCCVKEVGAVAAIPKLPQTNYTSPITFESYLLLCHGTKFLADHRCSRGSRTSGLSTYKGTDRSYISQESKQIRIPVTIELMVEKES